MQPHGGAADLESYAVLITIMMFETNTTSSVLSSSVPNAMNQWISFLLFYFLGITFLGNQC